MRSDMKVPWKWLNEYVELPWTPEEAAKEFGRVGLKVEELYIDKLDISGVVSARVTRVWEHPTRKELRVGTVTDGRQNVTVVSGAPGFREGNAVALALPGARLPGGTIISPRDVGGVISEGMVLCSNEILTGQPHRPGEDILLLPEKCALGARIQDLLELDDYVFEFELTVNFSHCLSILGVAIEASALSGAPLRLPDILEEWDWAGSSGSRPSGLRERYQGEMSVVLPDRDLCPRYAAKSIKGVRFCYSPITIERRLMLCGMRPKSAVVDVTNYVMLETGQPLHAFDQDKLSGKTIFARRAHQGERLVTIDGDERELEPGMLVIADEAGPVAVAGVMGGKETEVSMATRNVLIESAYFAPLAVRSAAQKLRLRTEAAIRFEKGVDPTAQVACAERACRMIAEIAGGEPLPGVAEADFLDHQPRVIRLKKRSVERTLGLDISMEKCVSILTDLRFGVAGEDAPGRSGECSIVVPPRRVDVTEEIDLVEEIARYWGYENIPAEDLPRAIPGGPPGKEFVFADSVRDMLVSLGGMEAVTNSLLSPADLKAMGWGEDDPRGNPVRILNPLSSNESCLRTSLLPGLARSLAMNQRMKAEGLFLWEIGRVFFRSPDELPLEVVQLGMGCYGMIERPTWNQPGRQASFYFLKGVVQALFSMLGLPEPVFVPGASMPFHPGKSARVVLNGSAVGEIGELHPACEKALDLAAPITMAWFTLDALLDAAKPSVYKPVSRFMAIERDLAVVVPEDVPAGDVVNAVKETGTGLSDVVLFDVYRNPPVPPGKKSLAMRLVYQPQGQTMTEEDLTQDRLRILAVLAQRFSAEQRM